jgi:hypothetical protein
MSDSFREAAEREIERQRALIARLARWALEAGHMEGCSRERDRPCDCGLHELLNSAAEEL